MAENHVNNRVETGLSGETAELLFRFARKHTPAPAFATWQRFKPPTEAMEFVDQLRQLHRLNRKATVDLAAISVVDRSIGNRLCTAAHHAAELLEPKLHPTRIELATEFDADTLELAQSPVRGESVVHGACVGLAYAIWHHPTLATEAMTANQRYQVIYEVFRGLAKFDWLGNAPACGIAQLIFCTAANFGVAPHRVVLQLMARNELWPNLLAIAEWSGTSELVLLSSLIVDPDHFPYDHDPLTVLQHLASLRAKGTLVWLGKHYRACGLATFPPGHPFAAYRLPHGLSDGTLDALLKQPSDEAARSLLDQMRQLGSGGVSFPSPISQEIWWSGKRALSRIRGKLKPEDHQRAEHKLAKLCSQAAGWELSHSAVDNTLRDLVMRPESLLDLISQRGRAKLAGQLERTGERTAWALGKLLTAIDQFSTVENSLLSACLCNDYLFDTTGRLCNTKTFEDFRHFVDRDIKRLRCFWDPGVDLPEVGHVRRLVSFIREFVADPNNNHYTNLEVKRTRVWSQRQ